ncbi:hypothetical protein [Mesorhizobium sp. B2-1-3]|nr:hypothetical protein [Mesorhizobium sp. B2-1-3]
MSGEQTDVTFERHAFASGRFRNRLKSARKSTQRLVTAARKIAAGAA